jgi:peptidyl-prolyl cis-trans isomerase SurA
MVSRLPLFLPLLALLAMLGVQPSAGTAAEVNRVAAVVNDDAISAVDLQMRVRMVQATSKLPDTEEVRQRLTSQILRKMIDERLMLQEAKRLKLTVSKEEVYKQLSVIEQQNRVESGSLEKALKQAGIPMTVLYRQLEAELSWGKVVRSTISPKVRVSEEEVKEHLAMLKANIGQPEYQLAEIVLAVDSPDREAEMAQTAERIIDQLRHGASFQGLARQFSQSPTSAAGGDMGWVPVASIEPEIAEVLGKMTPVALTPAIRLLDGFHIVMLRDRRMFGEKSSAAGAAMMIAQLFVPAMGDFDNATKRIREISAGAKNCAQVEEVAKKYHLPQSGRGVVKPAQMSPRAREFISGLKLLQLSQPVRDEVGVRMIMVCAKMEEEAQSESGLPSEEKIRSVLERQRIEMLAGRAMRELKRAAFLEIKK